MSSSSSGRVAAAAARAASGSAAAILESASSSCAAETNQHSNALGGRYTPASSIAWKNAAKRHVSWAWAPAKSVTGSVTPQKTLNMLPAVCSTCGTPAWVSASVTSDCADSDQESTRAYTSSSASRSVVRPAVVATGLPDSVPAW